MSAKQRGFASMDPERRAELARKGGLSAKPENRPFSKDKDLASRAGKKGGKISKPRPSEATGLCLPIPELILSLASAQSVLHFCNSL